MAIMSGKKSELASNHSTSSLVRELVTEGRLVPVSFTDGINQFSSVTLDGLLPLFTEGTAE